MMGRLNHDQEQLFYSFHLDEAVPHDHPVRKKAAVEARIAAEHQLMIDVMGEVLADLKHAGPRADRLLVLHR
jgi:hypothetical protein